MIFRLGRLLSGGARGPGVFFIIPCVDIYEKIDMRTSTYEIPPQEILTKDSVTVFVNAIMYYKVADATRAVANVDDYSGSARLLAATTLRNVLGTKNLGDILSERESIAHEMQTLLFEATEPWGVNVERVEVSQRKYWKSKKSEFLSGEGCESSGAVDEGDGGGGRGGEGGESKGEPACDGGDFHDEGCQGKGD